MNRKEFLAKLTELVKSFEGDAANNAFVSMGLSIENDLPIIDATTLETGINDDNDLCYLSFATNKENFSWDGIEFVITDREV
jgi:hypothetical protein